MDLSCGGDQRRMIIHHICNRIKQKNTLCHKRETRITFYSSLTSDHIDTCSMSLLPKTITNFRTKGLSDNHENACRNVLVLALRLLNCNHLTSPLILESQTKPPYSPFCFPFSPSNGFVWACGLFSPFLSVNLWEGSSSGNGASADDGLVGEEGASR